MPNRIENQAIKLYSPTETLFNDRTSICQWHENYSPIVKCDDVSEIVINMPEFRSNVGVDSDFSFVVSGNGSAGGTTNNYFDSGATFITDNVKPGMFFMIYLGDVDSITTGGVEILSVDSEQSLTLASGISFNIGDYYEISNWNYIGDIRTVNGYAEVDNQILTTTQSAVKQTIKNETLYKVDFTITFIDPDSPTSFLSVNLGSNAILNLFAEDIEAKTYTVFGESDGTLFQLAVDGNPKINIDNIVLTEMYETTFEVKDCETDVVQYTGIDSDFLYSNSLSQLKMSIDWSEVVCGGCYYIDVVQEISPADFSNKIINGTFTSDSDWIKGNDWSISGGKAHMATPAGIGASLTQDVLASNLYQGLSYLVNFTLENYVDGVVDVELYGNGLLIVSLGAFNSDNVYSISTGVLSADVDEVRFSSQVWSNNYDIDNVEIFLEDIYESYDYRTDCFNVTNDLTCKVKLSGTNNDNAFGIDFIGLSYNPSIRVPGELMNATYDGDKENEEDSSGISKTLYFKSEIRKDLFIFEVPEYHHAFIRLLLGYDVLKVDDIGYISTSAGYTPENERILGKLPDLSSSTTELRLKEDLNENKFC